MSDGYDADFYGDAADRSYLVSLTEVQREAILYERAQARQARAERRLLEQKIREREQPQQGKIKKTETDLKRERLEQLRAKRAGRPVQSEEEGEASSEEEEYESEEEEYYQKKTKKKTTQAKKRNAVIAAMKITTLRKRANQLYDHKNRLLNATSETTCL